MLLDLGDDVDLRLAALAVGHDAQRVVDLRQMAVLELDVDDRADDLDDLADLLLAVFAAMSVAMFAPQCCVR